MKIDGKRVLLTGGSSGIGLATARVLAARGARLMITGRNAERLAAAARELEMLGTKVDWLAADLSTDAGRRETVDFVSRAAGGVDILINNAGGVRASRLEDTTADEILTMININLVAPILLTRDLLPSLRKSGQGVVVNVASGIALIGVPFYSTYAAVKAGIARFGESLRRELKGEGVHVLTVYPGGTDTPMMKSNNAGSDLGFSREPAEEVAKALVAGIEDEAFDVIRGGEVRAQMIELNRQDPVKIDERFVQIKGELEAAVKGHSAL